MSKSDKKKAGKAADASLATAKKEYGTGVQEQLGRVGTVMPRSDAERAELNRTYGQSGFGGSDQSRYINELGAALPGGGGGSSGGGGRGGGGGGVVGATGGTPNYSDVWNELMGKEGGFDPTRLGNITGIAGKLRNAESNYTPSREAIEGLMGIGRTGGITDAQKGDINRDYLLETEKTGGYRPGDIENIRSRATAAAPGFYQNLQDQMQRKQGMGNFAGPGMDRSGFKMAREAAQQQGDTARDTEIGISDVIRSGRLDASKFLSEQGMDLASLESSNKLQGYGKAGELDISKNQAIQDALSKSAGIDLDTQGQITGARLGAAGAKSQDARARQAIGAANSAAAAARNDANKRWASQMAQEDRFFGAKGLSDTYTAMPTELGFNQNLLRDYRKDLSGAGQLDVGNRVAVGQMPGLLDDIAKVSSIAGNIGGAVFGGLPGAAMGAVGAATKKKK